MVTYLTIGFSLVLLAGMASGMHETLHYHITSFYRKFPGANGQYWNPKYSWTNKYKDGNPANGPRFPLSTTLLVMFTDAKHLFDAIRMSAGFSGFYLLGLYSIDFPLFYQIGIFFAAFTTLQCGFHLFYTVVF